MSSYLPSHPNMNRLAHPCHRFSETLNVDAGSDYCGGCGHHVDDHAGLTTNRRLVILSERATDRAVAEYRAAGEAGSSTAKADYWMSRSQAFYQAARAWNGLSHRKSSESQRNDRSRAQLARFQRWAAQPEAETFSEGFGPAEGACYSPTPTEDSQTLEEPCHICHGAITVTTGSTFLDTAQGLAHPACWQSAQPQPEEPDYFSQAQAVCDHWNARNGRKVSL